MRRIARVLVALAVCGAVAVAMAAANADGGARYFVELDNSFGLVEDGDVKIAGVRAGKIRDISLARRHMRARIEIEVTDRGFGDLRLDTRCEVRPQSLLGEYFLDCQPGVHSRRLQEGGTVPVEQTSSTIPLDLVQNIMRRPYRERWSIFLSELGVTLAARGDDLNEVIRRANPALRETDRVLHHLAEERETIRDLYRDADRILVRLADRRSDVRRFIAEARDTARASAVDPELAQTFERLPVLLQELRPTMDRLREASAAQRPALVRIAAEAPRLTRLLDSLGPFADASRPATRALAGAARRGRPAVRAATKPVRRLRSATRRLPEVATNLRIILRHVDDPTFAVEKDARAGRPAGGFTGLEALLRYPWAQSQAINVYDGNSYNLKTMLFVDRTCSSYANAEIARNEENARCRAWLGNNQPGVTTPDPTASSPGRRAHHRRPARRDRRPAASPRRPETPTPATTAAPAPAAEQPLAPLLQQVQDLLPRVAVDPDALLDFLLAP